jgi:hypothetical protein
VEQGQSDANKAAAAAQTRLVNQAARRLLLKLILITVQTAQAGAIKSKADNNAKMGFIEIPCFLQFKVDRSLRQDGRSEKERNNRQFSGG